MTTIRSVKIKMEPIDTAKNYIYYDISTARMIDSIEDITEVRRQFYKIILKQRYQKILLESYHKLMERESGQ